MEGYENQEGYETFDEAKSRQDYYSYGQNEEINDNDTTGTKNAEDGYYRPFEEPEKEKKKRSGFGFKMVKFVTLALSAGLISVASFGIIVYFFGTVTGSGPLIKREKVHMAGDDLYIAESTEAEDTVSGNVDGIALPAGAVTDVSDIVDQAMPSIVSITTISRSQIPDFFFGRTRKYGEDEGCGSGIIVSQDEENLYIATNHHVVDGAQTLTVLFADSSSVSAKIKGTDASSDLAVISVALEDIKQETKDSIRVAVFGDSSNLKMGQKAVAIGNSLGYGQSVTTGVISALDREVTVTNENDGSTITNELLQTSAAINPGNSGGALLNSKGEVIGITSVKYTETSVEGMGYAIPSKMAVPIVKQLITRELVHGSNTPYLGISGVDVTDDVSDSYSMPKGVYVAQVVEGSSADEAGLMRGDIITRFDGRNIKSMDEMQDLMRYLPAGSSVEVTIQRAKNGKYEEQTLEVLLGTKK